MNLNITARHFKLKPELRTYIEDKMAKLPKFHERIIHAEVVLGWEKLSRNVEIRLNVFNEKIIVAEKSDDLRKSFDLAIDKTERQLVKYKTKFSDKRKVTPIIEE